MRKSKKKKGKRRKTNGIDTMGDELRSWKLKVKAASVGEKIQDGSINGRIRVKKEDRGAWAGSAGIPSERLLGKG